MLRLAFLLAIVALLGATAAGASTPAQYKAAMNRICRTYTPLLHREETHLSTLAGVKRLAKLAVAQDERLEAQPVPAALAARMRPLLAELEVFHTQAVAALRAATAGHEAKAFLYLLRMQSEEPRLDRLFNGAGLRACGTEQ